MFSAVICFSWFVFDIRDSFDLLVFGDFCGIMGLSYLKEGGRIMVSGVFGSIVCVIFLSVVMAIVVAVLLQDLGANHESDVSVLDSVPIYEDAFGFAELVAYHQKSDKKVKYHVNKK